MVSVQVPRVELGNGSSPTLDDALTLFVRIDCRRG
jgi:hypothetical protein